MRAPDLSEEIAALPPEARAAFRAWLDEWCRAILPLSLFDGAVSAEYDGPCAGLMARVLTDVARPPPGLTLTVIEREGRVTARMEAVR